MASSVGADGNVTADDRACGIVDLDEAAITAEYSLAVADDEIEKRHRGSSASTRSSIVVDVGSDGNIVGGGGGPPVDICFGALLMFIVMGVGLLFPWNAILQATDFFLNRFPCTSIEFDIATAYMTTVLGTVVVALVIVSYCCLLYTSPSPRDRG